MLFSISFSLFLLMNPFGNIPLYISLLKGIPPIRQRQIIVREMLIALFVMIIFIFIGKVLLQFLQISQATVMLSGGMILFLISLKMVFPPEEKKSEKDLAKITEPFIVPLAIPLVAGPTILSAVILYSHQANNFIMIGAISIAWAFVFLLLYFSPFLTKSLGERGITAIERLAGLIMVMIAIQMFLGGIALFQTNGIAFPA